MRKNARQPRGLFRKPTSDQRTREDRPEGADEQQPGQIPSPLLGRNFLGEQNDRDAELRSDEHLGGELEGGERPDAPRNCGERREHRIADDRPQEDRAPADAVGLDHHEEGDELPHPDRDVGQADGGRADVKTRFQLGEQHRPELRVSTR